MLLQILTATEEIGRVYRQYQMQQVNTPSVHGYTPFWYWPALANLVLDNSINDILPSKKVGSYHPTKRLEVGE